jgi:hypothetical protein
MGFCEKERLAERQDQWWRDMLTPSKTYRRGDKVILKHEISGKDGFLECMKTLPGKEAVVVGPDPLKVFNYVLICDGVTFRADHNWLIPIK